MQHIKFDYDRAKLTGIGEAVLCEGKPFSCLLELAQHFNRKTGRNVLFTRLSPENFRKLPQDVQDNLDYHELSRTAFAFPKNGGSKRSVAIVTAGCGDAPVAWEAQRTLEFYGIKHCLYEDCGVAGLWRLTQVIDDINRHDLIIVVAGLDAALFSVLGGLSTRMIIGVPTSVGYGVAAGGHTALNSMLASCSPGAAVVNIDNGFGAACSAVRIFSSF